MKGELMNDMVRRICMYNKTFKSTILLIYKTKSSYYLYACIVTKESTILTRQATKIMIAVVRDIFYAKPMESV